MDSNGHIKIQLHNHTKYSIDSMLPFWAIRQLCIKNNIDVIAITDHNSLEGGLRFKEYCETRGNRPYVIAGSEIMTTQGEIIGLYLQEEIAPFQSVEDTIAQIQAQGGIVYVPHPYDEKRWRTVLQDDALEKYAHQVDCIEVWNGRNSESFFGLEQEKRAQKYNLMPVVGADAHTVFEFGKNYILGSHIPKSRDVFVEVLQNARLVQGSVQSFPHLITKLERIIRLIGKGDWRGIIRIINRKLRKS